MEQKIIPMIFNIIDLEENAKNGDGLSCYILGRSYDSGENGVKQNFKKALYWYNKGKELDDPRCIYGVGACYYFGDGVKEDKNKAYGLFIKAYQPLLKLIEQEKNIPNRQAFSMFCLGAYYYFGFGDVKKDDNIAFKFIYDSAMKGHIAGIYDLGANFYYNGVGTERDLEKSKFYLELASNYGLPRAIKKLQEYKTIYDNEININKKVK